jgi:hypothetical protein
MIEHLIPNIKARRERRAFFSPDTSIYPSLAGGLLPTPG